MGLPIASLASRTIAIPVESARHIRECNSMRSLVLVTSQDVEESSLLELANVKGVLLVDAKVFSSDFSRSLSGGTLSTMVVLKPPCN